ncbi:MAG: SDR family NAD(P)-dependent oxidoreductase [Bacteroidetes bacterium]|nr:SDR family NAD(P)-dependent oxidoreductase [Bacteroidota bacterium]
MRTVNNTILITGGSAGIGYELAKLFGANNKVIITGRNGARLAGAVARLAELGIRVTAIAGDVANGADVDELVGRLVREHGDLNVVINNAGAAAGVYSLSDEGVNAFDRAQQEMLTNYLAVIRLNEKLLPLLKKQEEAAIVNVSSIVSIVPGSRLSTYGASKAALHSYTLSLRHALAGTAVKVFELRPPLVATEFSSEIGGLERGIPASVVAEDLLTAFENDNYDVLVGNTADIYNLYLQSPEQAFLALNAR